MKLAGPLVIAIVIISMVNIDYVMATLLPPLERAPASNPRMVDSLGREITGKIGTGLQLQIASDLANNQDKVQPFAYIVQVKDHNNVIVSLSWLSGSLESSQSMTVTQSWVAPRSGNYTAEIFVWAGIKNTEALSPALEMPINVT